MNISKKNIICEKEDDVLNISFSKKPIDYADQAENVIVHFTKKGEPVYRENLNASDFLKDTVFQLPKQLIKNIFLPSFPSRAQKIK